MASSRIGAKWKVYADYTIRGEREYWQQQHGPWGTIWQESIRFVVLDHNRAVGLCTEKQKWTIEERTHRMLTWKPKCGKNQGSPQTAEKFLWEMDTTMGKAHRQRPLAPLLRHTRRLQWRQLPLSLTLSLSLSHSISAHALYNQLYNNVTTNNNMCALSHIYTYTTFRLFT